MLGCRIGFVGAGQMARALASGFLRAGLAQPDQILAYDAVPAAGEQFLSLIPGASLADSNSDVVRQAEIIFLAVKPQHLGQAITQAKNQGNVPDRLFVSIVAGVPLKTLCETLGTRRVVRVMPNTPCLVGRGASGYALGPDATAADGELVGKLLRAVGIAFAVEEKLLDAVTGLSGSGPAYAYLMIEALSDGGVRMGLSRAIATALAAQTLLGAAELVLTGNEHPAVLKDRVASPGGTTIAGLQALEEHGVRGALMAAVQAATRRSQELGA